MSSSAFFEFSEEVDSRSLEIFHFLHSNTFGLFSSLNLVSIALAVGTKPYLPRNYQKQCVYYNLLAYHLLPR